MTSFTIAFVVAFLVTGWVVRQSRRGPMPWDDFQLNGAQKFHAAPVPRVGGLGVAAALAALALWIAVSGKGPARELGLLLLAGLPALVAGLLERSSDLREVIVRPAIAPADELGAVQLLDDLECIDHGVPQGSAANPE